MNLLSKGTKLIFQESGIFPNGKMEKSFENNGKFYSPGREKLGMGNYFVNNHNPSRVITDIHLKISFS